ncbi:MAG: S8 family serine peptidase [Acidimicrobiales bacterium]
MARRCLAGVVGAGVVVAALVAAPSTPLTAGASPTTAGSTSPSPGSGAVEVVVKPDPGVGTPASPRGAALRAAAVVAGAAAPPVVAPLDRWVFTVPAAQAGGLVARMQASHHVQYAAVSGRVHATDVPDDPCLVGCVSGPGSVVEEPGPSPGDPNTPLAGTFNQANLLTVHAPGAWSITQGNPNMLVAVVDTGADAVHPDLVGKVVLGPTLCGADPAPGDTCTAGNAGSNDLVGHGSHVSGIIGASTDNGRGVAGLGWNTRVEVFKALDDQGAGSDVDVDNGIIDAVNSGARVINLSLSSGLCGANGDQACPVDPDMAAAVRYAVDHDVVVVAAAGNDGSDIPEYPADLPGVLSVGATDNNGQLLSFSEFGSAADIAAPGSNVVSTWNDGNYARDTGTSMSSPTVAAAAALMLAANPALSGPQVASLLEATAAPIPGNPISGGLLDVAAAVGAARNAPPAEPVEGYDLAGADGSAYSFGAAPFVGSLAGQRLNQPIVGLAVQPGALGYWMDASDGGVFSFGGAGYYGSKGGSHLNQPIVGMAATPDGRGYWLVASDGGIFAFGDAGFYGSKGGSHLNQPIVGMAATPDGRGYWLVASDGGIFAFGDAGFYGSTGAQVLNKPIVGMAAAPLGAGYWLVAADGGIFAFGGARFEGSAGVSPIPAPVAAAGN